MATLDLNSNIFDPGTDIDDEDLGFSVSGQMPQTVEALGELADMPDTIDEQFVLDEIKSASELSTGAFLVGQLVVARQEQRIALQNIQTSHITDRKNAMRSAQKTARDERVLGQAMLQHQFLMGAEQQRLQGMVEALASTSTYV